MKMVKSLILGSAAGLVAMSGAQAADLPVKAKPVEYVKVCSLYGAGFWYIPGTDTCIKLGGYLSVQSFFNAGISESPAWNGDIGQHNRFAFYFSSRSRFGLTVDTRTATEYGVVRTFAEAGLTFDSLGSNTNNPTTLAGLQGAPGTLLNTAGGGFAVLNFAFIQFAGFTFGKSASAFATPWHGFPGNTTAFLLGGHDTVNGVNNIQYTAQFGNGVSGTIGLDEGLVFNRTVSANLSVPLSASGALTNAYAGQRAPDIVGNIRVDQAWGLFQISAAAHQVSGSYNTLTGGGTIGATAAPTNASELSGHPDSKWGGAVMAALQLKNLPTGAGDDIKFDITYAKGDTKQVISSASTSPSFIMFGGTSLPGAYQSIGFGATTDAVWLPAGLTTPGFTGGDGSLHLTTAYGLRGAFNHNWDPYWSSSLFGSWSAVRYDDTAKANICAALIATRLTGFRSVDFSCNPDFNIAQVGVITRWTPVKGLAFSGEVMWTKLDQKFTGAAALTPAAPKPAAIYEFRDQSTVSTMLRVQRNF